MSFIPSSPTRVVLKVDVDTKIGLQDGVRNLVDLFAELGIKASFFIAMGPDNSGRTLKRLKQSGFLSKQLNSGALFAYGLTTMLYGLILPGPIIASNASSLFYRLIKEGHEIGVHGWNHVFWHDYLRYLPLEKISKELKQAVTLFRQVTGIMNVAAFASPGWQITEQALLLIANLGITHISCTRGSSPFRPLVQGKGLSLIELPTTMFTMDEALSIQGIQSNNVALYLARQVRLGLLNVFTLHAEIEGRIMLSAFRQFLITLLKQKTIFLRLIDAANQAANETLPIEKILWGRVLNRPYEVSFQASTLKNCSKKLLYKKNVDLNNV